MSTNPQLLGHTDAHCLFSVSQEEDQRSGRERNRMVGRNGH